VIDPIQLSIFRDLVESSAEEMGHVLERTSFSANIKERRDFSCAIFDRGARLLAQAAHIPVHLGSMVVSVRAVIDVLGTLNDGDVAIVNDPYMGGTHLPDMTLVSPIWLDGALVGYAVNRAHHADVGGNSPGSMTLSSHIEQEGIRIAPRLVVKAHAPDRMWLDWLYHQTRSPDERRGDIEAQINCNAIGARRLVEMVQKFTLDEFERSAHALIEYSRAGMQRVLARIPSGSWRFEDQLEGSENRPNPTIRVLIRREGARVRVDLSETDAQVDWCVNCPSAVARSAVLYCFECLLDEDVPINAGCFADIDVITREGTLVDARYPAPVVAGNTETSQRIVDVVFGALAKALPGTIPAASAGTMNSLAIGTDKWTYYETIGGGSGAGNGFDGASCVQCHMTNTLCTPVEALEMQYPLRVLRFERAIRSGGRGRYVGGDGIVREIQALQPCTGTILADRRTLGPWGLSGGRSGMPGRTEVIRADGGLEPLAAAAKFALQTGDRIRVHSPGGGGYGDPIIKSNSDVASDAFPR
jgi:N-methylhydantoinase B